MYLLVCLGAFAGATAQVTASVACHHLSTAHQPGSKCPAWHPSPSCLVCLSACTGATVEEPGSAALHCCAPFPGHCGHLPLCAAYEGSGHAGSQRSHQVISAPTPNNPHCAPMSTTLIVVPSTMKHQFADCHAYLQ